MTDRELLERLVGSWWMTGTMRETPLRQAVDATRVLNGEFIEVRVTDGTPMVNGRPYEAIYLIGAGSEGTFVLLLADVFGGSYATTPGIGRREGDTLIFTFDYPSGAWTWRWSPSGDGWELEQTYVENGERRLFATKRMKRRSGQRPTE